MAEIEHFVNPHEKNTPKFASVAGLSMNLLSAKAQAGNGEVIAITLGEAVRGGLIANETLGYFLGRTQLFLTTAGVLLDKLRFRQHQENEMAHYANDCWDAEIFTSYGWIECVGHADRGCFDLSRHSEVSGTNLQYYEEFKGGPKVIKIMKPDINKQLVGKTFKVDQKILVQHIDSLSYEAAQTLEEALATKASAEIRANGKTFLLTREMLKFAPTEQRISGENITPHVIEPSFGLGRIIYAVLEHSYRVREGEKRGKDKSDGEKRAFIALPPIIAPTKVSVLPLIVSDELLVLAKDITASLKSEGLSCKVDETGTAIGRKYARTDEIGIPFGITVDDISVKDKTVTLRERDTMIQVRIPSTDVAKVVRRLCDNTITWDSVLVAYPRFVSENKE